MRPSAEDVEADGIHRRRRRVKTVRRDDPVGAGAAILVGKLARQDKVQRLIGHASAGKDAGAARGLVGADDGDAVHLRLGPGFVEQRDVEDDDRRTGILAQEGGAILPNQGVDDGFQRLEAGRIDHQRRLEDGAVDRTVRDGTGEGPSDRSHRRATGGIEAVHGGIGVPDRVAAFDPARDVLALELRQSSVAGATAVVDARDFLDSDDNGVLDDADAEVALAGTDGLVLDLAAVWERAFATALPEDRPQAILLENVGSLAAERVAAPYTEPGWTVIGETDFIV